MMLAPILSVLLGWTLFSESLSAVQSTGCGLILASSALVIARTRKAPGYPPSGVVSAP